MKRIASFEVNHDKLKPGMYTSRIDGDITTYDIRMVYPKAVKDTKTVTLKYTAADDGAFVCLYSADTLCTIVRFET